MIVRFHLRSSGPSFDLLPIFAANQGYYRTPSIGHDTIVFCAEGDLWKGSPSGGAVAVSPPIPARNPSRAFRPTANARLPAPYEGPTEVYTMPLAGGSARADTVRRRRTVSFAGWTPGGELIFTTAIYSTLPDTQLVLLDLATGTATPGSAVAGQRGVLRRRGEDALFHPACVPGQPHQALQGRHGAEALEVQRRRQRGRAADRQLRRHQQVRHVAQGPRLLRQRPRRHDEPLVDGRERQRRQAAHQTQGIRHRRPRCLAARSSISSGAGPGSTTSRPTRRRSCRSRSNRISTRCARELGQEADGLPHAAQSRPMAIARC